MRIRALALVLVLATNACVEDTVDRTAAKRALDEATIATQAQAIVAGFVEMAASGTIGDTPGERAAALTTAMNSALDCGTVAVANLDCASHEDCCSEREETSCSDERCATLVCTTTPDCCETAWSAACATTAAELCDGTVVSVTMPEDGCTIRDQVLSGSLVIDVGDEPDTARLSWRDVTDSGVTVSGTTTVSWANPDNREISHVGTLALNSDSNSPYRFQDAWLQTPTVGGVLVAEASRCSVLDSKDVDCWTAEGVEACTALEVDCRQMTSSNTALLWAYPVPISGTNTVELITTGRQRRVELTFSLESSSAVHVDAAVWGMEDDQPRTTLAFDVLL